MSAEDRDAQAAAAAANRGMSSLEMESAPAGNGGGGRSDEMESLVTAGGGSGMKQRAGAGGGGGAGPSRGLFAALLERNQNFSARNLLLMGGLGGLVFFFLKDVDRAVFSRSSSSDDDAPPPPPAGGFHGSSFGGKNNLGHPAGARAYSEGEFAYEEIFVPVSNVGRAVPSIGPENVLNFMGHYVHDEHRSPYASHLYRRNLTELDEEQRKYEGKMEEIRRVWGAWKFSDDFKEKHGVDRPVADFSKVDYMDLPNANFPEGAWQADPEYVTNFLSEAKEYVVRVKEGIYAEYGQPTTKADGTKLTAEEIADRDKRFAVAHAEGEDRAGKLGWLNPNAWDGLVRKLLHAMMTNDEFYVVMGGHSAAAGHGNEFRQAKMMAFHYLMEPLFDKLGMRLLSRSMAQGGVGTTHSAMASGSLYGEKDILFWDSGMTERAPGAHDLFNKQAILGGERVPILMNSPPVNIMADSNGTAWLGHNLEMQNGAGGMVPFVTQNESHADSLPFAVRYMFCAKEAGGICAQHKYNAICWEPRSDFEPSKPQQPHPGSQVSWHPGVRTHLQAARSQSMVVLHALEAAIDLWRTAADNDDVPLPEEHWHVGQTYKNIQDILRTKISTAAEGASACEKMLPRFPRACRVAVRGFGEWTPRRNPTESGMLSILRPAPNGYLPHQVGPTEFAGINLLPLVQRVPEGHVDVHAIALASTDPAPHLDHSIAGEEERRKLIQATHDAVRHRTTRAREAHDRRRRVLKEAKERQAPPPPPPPPARNDGRRLDGEKPAEEEKKTEEIVPGRGWVYSDHTALHFCDGSYASECGRFMGSNCLNIGHNDGRAGFMGDSLSGWLVFDVPNVKEGLILLRIEWWAGGPQGNALTKDWTEVNDGKTNEAEPKFVFPDVTPKVNATTPFAKLKAAKEAKAKAEKAEAKTEKAEAKAETKAEPAPAAPAKPAAAPAKPAAAPANATNATRGLLRARSLATSRIRRTTAAPNAPFEYPYPFEHVDADEIPNWSVLAANEDLRHRRAKFTPPPIPDDFLFDIAVNGKIVKTMDKTEFMSHSNEIVKNWAIWTVMDDPQWAKRDWGDLDGESVECAVRFRGTRRGIRISHVYYA